MVYKKHCQFIMNIIFVDKRSYPMFSTLFMNKKLNNENLGKANNLIILYTEWPKKSLWCDLEEKRLRNSKICFDGVFLSIYSHLLNKLELSKLCGSKNPEHRLFQKSHLSKKRHIILLFLYFWCKIIVIPFSFKISSV